MIMTTLKSLAWFAGVIAYACFVLAMAFFYSQTPNIFQFYVGSGNKTTTVAPLIVSVEGIGITQVGTDERITVMIPGKKPMEPCPETPPQLAGPLLVDFKSERTLEDVRKKVLPLEKGGRYKPPHCISQQKVAVIIPFRNRHQHLKHWLFYLHPILKQQQLDYGIYVINQEGKGKFNRAKLFNVGYVEALKEYDYDCFVFSDVDLVPIDDRNLYRCYDKPRHMSPAVDKFNFKLIYATIFGGVVTMTKEQFAKINGYSNSYWGWGGEDDDLYQRVVHRKMSISRPDMLIGRYKMIKHERDVQNEDNPVRMSILQKATANMDKDGLNSLKYNVTRIEKDSMFTNITVDIYAPQP